MQKGKSHSQRAKTRKRLRLVSAIPVCPVQKRHPAVKPARSVLMSSTSSEHCRRLCEINTFISAITEFKDETVAFLAKPSRHAKNCRIQEGIVKTGFGGGQA